jgi:DNA-binding MarR family transcriptional regulator
VEMQTSNMQNHKSSVVSFSIDDGSKQSSMKAHLEQLQILCLQIEECADNFANKPSPRVEIKTQSAISDSLNHSPLAFDLTEDPAVNGSIHPDVLRKIIRYRKLRVRYFGRHLFADPAWDMLLDLAVAYAEGEALCVSSLGYASGVPATTSLRWIGQLVKMGLVERIHDEKDKRRTFIRLSNKGIAAVQEFFAEVGSDAQLVI